MTQTNTRQFAHRGPFDRYTRTISWLYRQAEARQTLKAEDRPTWVSASLAEMHHWDALEEHLGWVARLERVQSGDSAC